MSSSIWTQCAGASELRPLRLSPWRIVEAQHQVSTRKLVDTLAEQAILEDLIDRAKPPALPDVRLHYLLSTPFRYPPLRHGSRFAARHERSLWYGSESLETAFAEVAYYRFVFLAGSRAELVPLSAQLTAFTVRLRTASGIDLTVRPFAVHAMAIASPIEYAETQALGGAMRASGVEAFRYPSARWRGVNVGIFTPAVFGTAKPRGFETWHGVAAHDRVEVVRHDFFERPSFVYPRTAFLVGGELPAPAL